MCDVHLRYRIYIETTCIDNLPMSPTSIGRVAAMLRLSVAWVTLGKFNREPKIEPKEQEPKPKEPEPKNSIPDIEEPK